MKKVLSKILVIMLISIFIIEFAFANQALAFDENYTAEIINSVTNIMGGIVSIVLWQKRINVTAVAYLANLITTSIASWENGSDSNYEDIDFLTPFHIFFNKCKILDINFFDMKGLSKDSVVYKIRYNVSQWYYIMRLIAIVILLVILLYVGIRMALSTLAEDKAKYKKMLFDWICSLALVFLLQYIAIFTIYANSAILSALEKIVVNAQMKDSLGAIGDALTNIGKEAVLGIGINNITSVIVYALLIFQTIGYLIAYFNRMIKIAFLLIISPLITITYSIDKMGDGKSQALNNWLKEFIYTILIQPFHCIVYVTFISVAMGLIVSPGANGIFSIDALETAAEDISKYNQLANAILAVLCVKFIKDAEEMVRKIFGFKDNNKGTSLAAGLAVSAVALSKAKDVGKGARNIANKGSKYLGKFNNVKTKAFDKLKDTKAFKALKDSKVGELAKKGKDLKDKYKKKVGDAKKKYSDKFKKFAGNNKAIKGFKKGMEAGKKFWNSKPVKWLRKKNSLSGSLGVVAALAAYASSDSGALHAIGVGNAAYESADAFLTSSASTIGSQNAEDMSQLIQPKVEEAKKLEEELKDITEEEKENIREAGEEYEKVAEEVEDEVEEAEQLDKEIPEKEAELKASSERMKEYREAGAYDQEAQERSNRAALTSEIAEKKKRRAELEESIKSKEEYLEQNSETYEKYEKLTRYEELTTELERYENAEGNAGIIGEIMAKGESGEFGKIEETITADLTELLGDAKASSLLSGMKQELAANSKDFNLEATLRRCLGSNISSNPNYSDILNLSNEFRNNTLESQIYDRTKFSMGMNVTQEKIAEQTSKRMRND